MSWQNPHQPGWSMDGQPITAVPMPMPTQLSPYPEAPLAPSAGAVLPQHGAPQPPYGAPQPAYGAPQPAYGAPQPQYGAPQPPYGSSQPSHTAPLLPHGAAPHGGWPMPNSNCPPGLEYLMSLNQLFVDQKVEMLEAFVGWETENKYSIKDMSGQIIYHAAENSHWCGRVCCGKNRSFDLNIVDNQMREVISLQRPLKCSSCWCPCCLQELDVFSSGVKIGSVIQHWNPFRASFSVCNADGNVVLRIKGPICFCYCYEADFDVLSADEEHKVGRISKKWSGFVQEIFTDSDMFGISFPQDLDVKIKAVLLGACLLIDFMYFEDTTKAKGLSSL